MFGDVPLVAVNEAGAVAIHLPPDAEGTLTTSDHQTFALHDLVSIDAARPFRASPVTEAPRISLPSGGAARIETAGRVFEIALVRLSDIRLPKPPRGSPSRRAPRIMALSFAMHVGLVGTLAYHMPKLGEDDTETVAHDQHLLNLTFVDGTSEDEPVFDDDDEGTFCPHHEVGVVGTLTTRDKEKRRYGVAGPSDNADPHLARLLAEGPSAPYAFAAIVLVPISGDRKAYTMPWGRDDALGTDPSSARGRTWGDLVGDVYGYAAIGARPPPPPPEEEEEEDTSLFGLIPSTVGHGTGFVPTSFDAALWRRDDSEP